MQFAMLFPGQGSQSVGMMQGLADIPVIQETFQQASDILHQDYWKMVTEPNELLNQTQYTQPLMLIAGVATWRLWQQEVGIMPSVMAGHSLGEYTALVASGVIDFAQALPLVQYRAEVMQAAVAEGEGAMAAILGLDDQAVVALCEAQAQGQIVEAVNFNSPGQVVIAGHRDAVERGMEAAKQLGAKRALLLPVSVPSHCRLMQAAAEQLATYLAPLSLNTPAIPVLHNADVASYVDSEQIKAALSQQLYRPVRWVETIQKMYAQGISLAFESGPGKVLTGLNKRIVEDFTCIALVNLDNLNQSKTLIR